MAQLLRYCVMCMRQHNPRGNCLQAVTALCVFSKPAEQYPKALGNTVKELQEVLPEGTVTVDKTKFSMCGASAALINALSLTSHA